MATDVEDISMPIRLSDGTEINLTDQGDDDESEENFSIVSISAPDRLIETHVTVLSGNRVNVMLHTLKALNPFGRIWIGKRPSINQDE